MRDSQYMCAGLCNWLEPTIPIMQYCLWQYEKKSVIEKCSIWGEYIHTCVYVHIYTCNILKSVQQNAAVFFFFPSIPLSILLLLSVCNLNVFFLDRKFCERETCASSQCVLFKPYLLTIFTTAFVLEVLNSRRMFCWVFFFFLSSFFIHWPK